MRGIRFTADITDDPPATPASLAYFMNRGAKAVARWHSASHDWSAISPHDHAVIRPPRRGEIEGARADMGLQLRRAADVRKASRFRVAGATTNTNGQATSGPAVIVQRGVHVDHQALPQTAFLPFWRSEKGLSGRDFGRA